MAGEESGPGRPQQNLKDTCSRNGEGEEDRKDLGSGEVTQRQEREGSVYT